MGVWSRRKHAGADEAGHLRHARHADRDHAATSLKRHNGLHDFDPISIRLRLPVAAHSFDPVELPATSLSLWGNSA